MASRLWAREWDCVDRCDLACRLASKCGSRRRRGVWGWSIRINLRGVRVHAPRQWAAVPCCLCILSIQANLPNLRVASPFPFCFRLPIIRANLPNLRVASPFLSSRFCKRSLVFILIKKRPYRKISGRLPFIYIPLLLSSQNLMNRNSQGRVNRNNC